MERYKLRLADGTILLVDEAGLSIWLVDSKAMVQPVGTHRWYPLNRFLAEYRVPVKPAAAPPPSVVPTSREPAPVPSPGEPEELPAIGEPAGVQSFADEPAAHDRDARQERPAPADPLPALRLKPLDDEPPSLPPDLRPREPAAVSDGGSGAQPRSGGSPRGPSDGIHSRREPPDGSDRPVPEALAEGPSRPEPARRKSPTHDELPIIPFKPLEDEAPRQPPAPRPREPEALSVSRDRPVPEALAEGPSRPEPARRKAPNDDDVPIIPFKPLDDPGPSRPAQARRDPSIEGVPVIPLKSLDDDEAPPPSEPTRPVRQPTVWKWLDDLVNWVARLTSRSPGPTSSASNEPAPSSTADAMPQGPLKGPPPVSELPVLRFADDLDEPREAGHVYEEESEGVLHAVWRWTKRLVLTAALLAAGALAVQNWEAWLPKAEELGRMAMTEVERQNRNEELERALREASEQLPHLAPETIRLILSASPSGALDAPEIFHVASDAADRGLPALTAEEAAELRALRSQLLDKVLRAQRERVQEYDRTRARRAVFPFEDRAALDVTVSGFRKIPQPSQARFQTLLGKAIGAGLALPAEGVARTSPRH